jgi:exosome complex component RRP45
MEEDEEDERDKTMESTANSSSISIIHCDDREPTPLPIHHTPLFVSFALFSDPTASSSTIAALLDPNVREEMVQDGTITFGFNKYGELTCLDFPGGCEMHPRQMMACADLGKKKCIELCNMFEEALQGAEEKAEKDRIQRLRLKFQGLNAVTTMDPSMDFNSVMETEMDSNPSTFHSDKMSTADQEDREEELYRMQALDYSVGHVAVKVKENTTKKDTNNRAGALLEAMIQSATHR